MIAMALVILPAVFGLLSLFLLGEGKRGLRRLILMTGAVAHAAGTVSLHVIKAGGDFGRILHVDPLGLLFLSLVSLLFLIVSIYSIGYFQHGHNTSPTESGALRGRLHPALPVEGATRAPLYAPCMLFFLAAMTLTTVTSQLGIFWVAIELTTVSSAPLIYYHHHRRALEAAWKYLLICSVGIAIALLGIFFIAASGKGALNDLSFASITAVAKSLDRSWLRIGFLLALVGFGTKMGLAPLHNWLPEAHSEAPSPVSALLSGALLNCAFLGILRLYQVCVAAGLAGFAQRLLVFFGLFSLLVAAVFVTVQKDYKRLLAYSSIEHMGIMAFGIGINAGFASLLHAVNHSLAKALLFLTAGQILIAYRTKTSSEVQGLLKTVPATGLLFLVGGLAIVGAPPFGPFVSEFLILREGITGGHTWAVTAYLFFLGVVFVAMSRTVLRMVQGEARELPADGERPSRLMVLPVTVLAVFVLVFGLWLPSPMISFLKSAAALLGGTP